VAHFPIPFVRAFSDSIGIVASLSLLLIRSLLDSLLGFPSLVPFKQEGLLRRNLSLGVPRQWALFPAVVGAGLSNS